MALTQEFGVTAAILTGEVCPRYPSSTTTPMTTANLGEVITDAAAWWQQHLRRAGLTQTNINGIDATNEPGLFRRCREAVKKKAAIPYLAAMAPLNQELRVELQADIDHAASDLHNNPAGFLAELYSANSHSRVRSHILSIPTTDDDTESTHGDDVTPLVHRKGDNW